MLSGAHLVALPASQTQQDDIASPPLVVPVRDLALPAGVDPIEDPVPVRLSCSEIGWPACDLRQPC